MAVTLAQMADAYIKSVTQQIEQAKGELVKMQDYIQQLETHLIECRNVQEIEHHNAPIAENQVGSTTTKIELPNPFDQIKAQT